MSEKKVATTPPSGLAINRSGYYFTFKWNIADKDYGAGQQFFWTLNGVQQGAAIDIGKKTTSKTVWVNVYSTVVQIGFGVRGQRKKYEVTKKKKKTKYNPTWSNWSTYVVAIGVPNATQPTYALDTSHDYSGTFSGSIDLSVDEYRPFWRWEWQSVLVKDWNSAGIYTGWSNAGSADGIMFTGSDSTESYSFPRSEESELFVDRNASYTRFLERKLLDVLARPAGYTPGIHMLVHCRLWFLARSLHRRRTPVLHVLCDGMRRNHILIQSMKIL